ncbi:MAG TPA: acyl-CoA dehydrogenase family protein, partial [Homoserinimonas sp.]|nr:acyl-CoA dehydrogenase family protein [Homoserinimonas sp.]
MTGDAVVGAEQGAERGRGVAEFHRQLRILDESIAYAAQAKQGGEPIGTFQLVQGMIGESYAELRAAKALA